MYKSPKISETSILMMCKLCNSCFRFWAYQATAAFIFRGQFSVINLCLNLSLKFLSYFLPPAYVVRQEGNVLTRVCPSVCPRGVPISHNALQHYPEFHGTDTGGTLPGPAGGAGVPCWGWGYPAWVGYPARGYPARGATLPGGVPCDGVPW